MRRLALQLCVIATAHSARLVYTTPRSAERLEICVPAKAGSTTIFHALHRAIVGTEFNALTSRPTLGPGYVQNVAAWSRERACDQVCFASLAQQHRRPSLLIRVVRDPLERYASAYFDKFACCASPGPGGPKRHCNAGGARDGMTEKLVKFVGLAFTGPCLYWDEYVAVLLAAERLGKQGVMNNHVQPQHLECPVAKAVPSVTVKTRKFRDSLRNMTGFGGLLQRVGGALDDYPVRHASNARAANRSDPPKLEMLCDLAAPEYRALRMRPPSACTG